MVGVMITLFCCFQLLRLNKQRKEASALRRESSLGVAMIIDEEVVTDSSPSRKEEEERSDNNNNDDDEIEDIVKLEEIVSVRPIFSKEPEEEESTKLQRFRRKYFPKKTNDGLTFKQKMAKAGLSVVLSYGWISNVTTSVTVSLAWYIFSKNTGLSPLAPGQWKGFLAIYAGFYVFNSIIRPLRFGLSVGVSVYFDRVIQKIQDIFKVKKGLAIFLTVFLANIVGTCTLMASGIFLASTAAGVPVWG
mmetsp:Transcript_24109/g.27473  ORF Transcript_24109/g.27473 Transcript_24109/m.27473 type:complete len:247 (-) Transcript_24109:232-972(-)